MKIRNRVKKVIAVLLSGVLVFGLGVDVHAGGEDIAVQDAGTGTHEANHPLCNDADCGDASHRLPEETEWQGVDSLDEIKGAGYYYLTQSVNLTTQWRPASGVVLCLNGNNITVDSAVDAIGVFSGSNFTLTDCRGSGKITHSIEADSGKPYLGGGVYVTGTFTMYGGNISGNLTNSVGGGVWVGSGGTFQMHGGSITDNIAEQAGGGVYMADDTAFTMTGGEISGNTACYEDGIYDAGYGGGVYVKDGASMTVGGTAKVCDNLTDRTLNSETGQYESGTLNANNVYLEKASTNITVGMALTEAARIGVSMKKLPAVGDEAVTFVKAGDGIVLAEADAKRFFSDAGGDYRVKLKDDNTLGLFVDIHKHYLCGEDDCNKEGGHSCSSTIFTKWEFYDSLPTEGAYYLTGDVTLSADSLCTLTGDLVLCLNGYGIAAEGEKLYDSTVGAIAAADGNTFTLTDCNGSNGAHKFSKDLEKGNLWVPDTEGEVTVTGGVITHSRDASGIGVLVRDKGNFIMYGGTICGNRSACPGAGVYVKDGSFTMYGGAIRGNYDWGARGGGVGVNNYISSESTGSSFTMNGGEISDNTSNGGGGGVYVCSTGTFTMNGGKISGNTATSNGGGVQIERDSSFTMNGGKISGNSSKYDGGGVYIYGTFTMVGGTIGGEEAGEANIATGNGGGVSVGTTAAVFQMSGGAIINNTAANFGGGVLTYGSFTMSDGVISGNRAKSGAGVYVTFEGSAAISGGTIGGEETGEANIATGNGGGVFAGGSLTMSGGAISGNKAGGSGGGVYMDEYNVFTMTDGRIRGNTAETGDSEGGGGGVFLKRKSQFIMSGNAVISGNKASNAHGGGVYTYGKTGGMTEEGSIFEMNGGTISGNTAAGSGGGVYMYLTNGSMTVSGPAKIQGNWLNGELQNGVYVRGQNGTAGNVYLPGEPDSHGLITISGALTGGTGSIGVSKEAGYLPGEDSPVQVAAAVSDGGYTVQESDAKVFFADAGSGYQITKSEEDNNLYMVVNPHECSWSYTASGAVITAKCNECNADGGSVTIEAPANPSGSGLVYDGQDKAATVKAAADWQGPSADTISVTYQAESGNGFVSNGENEIPRNAGNYKAVITLAGADNIPAIAGVTYEIKRADLTISGLTAAGKTYDGTAAAAITDVVLDGLQNGETLTPGTGYTVSGTFDTAAAGVNKEVTVIVELKDTVQNYTFTEGANRYVVTGGRIEKATVADPAAVELVILSGAVKTYTITLPALPALTAPAEYGNCSYTVGTVGLTNGYDGTAAISNDGRELTLDITTAGSGTGDVGTITVQVKTDNYTDITLTVKVSQAASIPTPTPVVPTPTPVVPTPTPVVPTPTPEVPTPTPGAPTPTPGAPTPTPGAPTPTPGTPTPTPEAPTPTPDPFKYKIMDGADSTWEQDTDGSLVIRGNGEYSQFRDVKVDGVVIDSKNYTVAEGSTIITLKTEYLETLSEGSHTFEIVWTDGSAATSFVVNLDDSGDDDETPPPTPGAGSGNNTPGATVPPTGDNANPALWITLLMAALAGIAVLLAKGKIFKK